jgi:hypothetical protein
MIKSLVIIIIFCRMITYTVIAQEFETGMYAYERHDYATALRVLSSVAEGGDPDAQYMLGRLYANGHGVLQDYVQAYKWYNLAASQGQRFALAARDAIAERMTAEQVAKGQELAWDWRPEPGAAASSPAMPGAEDAGGPEEIVDETTIARIQLQLKQLGYPLDAITGRLDPKTQAAIRGYQLDNNLFIDGKPSQKLLEHIFATVGIEEPAIRKGNATPAPIQLQEKQGPRLQ